MVKNKVAAVKNGSSFWRIFRVIYVLFSLYLLGDAFSRWDGFSFYATFSELLPSVALAYVLWSILAALTAILLWLICRLVVWVARLLGFSTKFHHLLLYLNIIVFLGVVVWGGKRILWPGLQTTFQIKLAVLVSVAFISTVLTRIFFDKAEKWVKLVNERITPLLYLFGILMLLSVPLVSYHAWLNNTGELSSNVGNGADKTNRSRPNIILVTFDALAAGNMSLYDYQRDTTPFIERWSQNATVFTMAEANSNFTTPAVASLMTGKRVWTHQTYHIEGSKPVRSKVESLSAVLKEQGYFNIALVVNPFASVRVLGMSDSFDIAPLAADFSESASLFGWKFGTVDKFLYRLFGERIRIHNWVLKNDFIFSKVLNLVSRNITHTTVPPEKAFNRFLDIIDNSIQAPFFAWIHVFPPHDPYLPPETYQRVFNSSLELGSYKKQEMLVEESYKYLFSYRRYPEEMQPAVDLMKDYYDDFVGYIDKSFGNFADELNKRQLKNTTLILSADHGESFEHGYFTHGGPFLFEQVTHIPLVIKEPGQKHGRIITDMVEQIDIPATILNLAGIPIPSWMEGRSLVPLINGEKLADRPAFTMNLQGNRSLEHQITKGSIAVWEGDYKLIHYLERNESQLFNIKQDPYETQNIIDREYEIGQHLLVLIQDNLKRANEKIFREKKQGH